MPVPPVPSGERTRGGRPRIVPLFPLPNVFLFPGCVMPLHIFEPRYRQMVEDQLDGPGQIVMGTVPREHADDLAGSSPGRPPDRPPGRPPVRPPVRPIGGLGEILRHERLPDGRFLIWLFGLSRVSLRETPWEAGSERLYRRVEIEPLLEIAPAKDREPGLRERLREAIQARSEELKSLPEKIPISCLADLLLQRLSLPQSRMEELYEELDVEARAQAALAAHARRPVGRSPRRGGTPG